MRRAAIAVALVLFIAFAETAAAGTREEASDGAARKWLALADTVFANKKDSIETVTMSLEKDGAKRASGYFIR